MRTRILPRDEWGRVAKSNLLPLLASAESADVHVIEDGPRIVACFAEVRVTLLEGLWIDPEYRGNAGVCRRLVRTARAIVERCGWTVSGVATDCMRDVMRRLGAVRMERDTYVFSRGDT